jgi:hypothetical protein
VVNRFSEERALRRNQNTTRSITNHEIPINREEIEASRESDASKFSQEAPNHPPVRETEEPEGFALPSSSLHLTDRSTWRVVCRNHGADQKHTTELEEFL